MSEFRRLVEEVKQDQALGEDILDEGWGKTLGTLATAAAIGMGANDASGLTDPEALRSGAHQVTAQYEHGGKGYKAIVKDNYGGYSYGKEQLSTRRLNSKHANSTFDAFIKYAGKKAPYIKKSLDAAGGWEGAFKGTPTFKQAWLKLADQKEFQDVYDDFILDTQVMPVFDRMDQATSVNLDKITRWGSQNAAMQAAIRSAIIQHGRDGAFRMICDVVKAHNPANMGEFIRNLYNKRAAKFPKYKSRYTAECNDVIEYLKSNDSNIDVAYGHKPGQSGYELDQLINKIAANPVQPEKVSVKNAKATPAKKVAAKK